MTFYNIVIKYSKKLMLFRERQVICLRIKSLEFDTMTALAPLAGVADTAMRELCIGYGAAFSVCEMASAKGISLGDKKSANLMTITKNERPAGIQLFGNSPCAMRLAAQKALQYSPDFIDINMGCPVPKVVSSGAGASLMKNPALAGSIVKAVVQEVGDVPVTVKMRSGWNDETKNAVLLARICQENGVAAVTVHGRTREQMFALPVDYGIIREVKQSLDIPVIGNGEVFDGKSAAKLLYETGCDMIMVGRGAMGRPWVFSQINAYLHDGTVLPEPAVSERMRVMLRHVKKICEYKGDFIGIREARKHAAWYVKGIRGAAFYRAKLSQIESFDELAEIAFHIVSERSD